MKIALLDTVGFRNPEPPAVEEVEPIIRHAELLSGFDEFPTIDGDSGPDRSCDLGIAPRQTFAGAVSPQVVAADAGDEELGLFWIQLDHDLALVPQGLAVRADPGREAVLEHGAIVGQRGAKPAAQSDAV